MDCRWRDEVAMNDSDKADAEVRYYGSLRRGKVWRHNDGYGGRGRNKCEVMVYGSGMFMLHIACCGDVVESAESCR